MRYTVSMYISRIPNRSSPPAILLRESYREEGKVKTRTLANLSKLPGEALGRLRHGPARTAIREPSAQGPATGSIATRPCDSTAAT